MKCRRILILLLCICVCQQILMSGDSAWLPGAKVYAYSVAKFDDVNEKHWAYDSVMTLRELKVTEGIGGNKFGVGQKMNREQFAVMLGKVMQVSVRSAQDGQNESLTWGVLADTVMEALGYEHLSLKIGSWMMANDLGLIPDSHDAAVIQPAEVVTREYAAEVLVRIYKALQNKIDFLNGFYAIKSNSQASYMSTLDSVGFGWCRLEADGRINDTTLGGNDFFVPSGFNQPYNMAKQAKKNSLLMVTIQDIGVLLDGEEITLTEFILNDPAERSKYAELISKYISGGNKNLLKFDGVVIDFENMKGDVLKVNFVSFLKQMRGYLGDKLLYVAVHPVRGGFHSYYDAYDYAAIGELADKVILMAHDYNAKRLTEEERLMGIVMTPLAPLDEIYIALKAITDKQTGVRDTSKIVLQVSFDAAQWKLRESKVINVLPYRPDYETLYKRMITDVKMNYSYASEAPYITFYNDDDKTDNVVWYEDSRSVNAKIKLAKMFGITGISLWRLGNIPSFKNTDKELFLDIWNMIAEQRR